jgi:hypothetical protein
MIVMSRELGEIIVKADGQDLQKLAELNQLRQVETGV